MLGPDDDIPLLTVAEAAEQVRKTPRTIGRWIASGDLPFIPSHPERLIRLDKLQATAKSKAKHRRETVRRKYSGGA